MLVVLLLSVSCGKQNEEPVAKCGIPTTNSYFVGEIDAACVFIETGGNWVNVPGTVNRFNCGQILKSDFISYTEDSVYSVILTIPHSEGQDCDALSPNAIQIGRYELIKGNSASEPGLAGFSMKTSKSLFASWPEDLDQDAEAYFEVTLVEDIPPVPGWHFATYFKRVSGKVNCKLKDLYSNEPSLEIKNIEFSGVMIY